LLDASFNSSGGVSLRKQNNSDEDSRHDKATSSLIYSSDVDNTLLKTDHGFDHRKSTNPNFSDTFSHALEVYKKVMIPSLSVFFTFTVTIAIFPALTVLVESTQKCENSNRFFNDLFSPFLFLMFNVFDFLGRIAAGSTRPIFTPKNIWIGSLARIIFWPAFLFLNVSNSQLPILFPSDACPILFMAIMAFTNGYIASNSMMMGASIVPPQDSSLAGTIMVFSLTLGLFGGACFSFLIVYISQGGL
jgi:equilibrative nucleoside transporter 1/2/3